MPAPLRLASTPAPSRLALKPAEAADSLGVCRAHIYNLIARGELRAVKIGRSTRIPITEVERLAGVVAP